MPMHRKTGKPVGRPKSGPVDMDAKIVEWLRSRVDPQTGLAEPRFRALEALLKVSRSTVIRRVRDLRKAGKLEIVYEEKSPKLKLVYYRVKD